MITSTCMHLAAIVLVRTSKGFLRIEGHPSWQGQEMLRDTFPLPLTILQRNGAPVKLVHAHTVSASPGRARGGRLPVLSIAFALTESEISLLTPPLQ